MDNTDIRAVLSGREIFMPRPVRSRRYDDRFWAELMEGKETAGGSVPVREDDLLRDLGF